jgi:hypothetical protein
MLRVPANCVEQVKKAKSNLMNLTSSDAFSARPRSIEWFRLQLDPAIGAAPCYRSSMSAMEQPLRIGASWSGMLAFGLVE